MSDQLIRFRMVIVLGRPSIHIGDFFNSIKFHSAEHLDYSEEHALANFTIQDPTVWDGGYVVIARYAFPLNEKVRPYDGNAPQI